MTHVHEGSYAPDVQSDLLNPPGRPCRCGGMGCNEAAAWCEPGEIATAVRRDRIRRRIQTLRDAFATSTPPADVHRAG